MLCSLQPHVVPAFEKCDKRYFNYYKLLIWSFIVATLEELLRHIYPSKTSINRSSIIAIAKQITFRILSHDHNDVTHRWYKWFTTARLMYHMRGSDGVRSMMEQEWGHRWLLQAWDNLAANFWLELNTNAQTQHATAAAERTNTQHSPALMQLFKTNKKNWCTSLFDLAGGRA